MMAEAIVKDWLSEYASLQPSELEAFVNMHENNQEIAEALYTIFNERLKYPDLVHSVCNQFYSFYRSSEEGLKRFTMQFIPILIYIYLNSVTMGDKKNCRSVETLLISIYNVEVSTEDGYQKIVSFRMPVLAQASIYHEEKSLHAVDLRRWEENSNRDIKWGPMPQIESINAQNRMKVMTTLLFSYNQQLCLIQKSALFHLCRISSQIVNQGFSKPGHAHRSSYGNDSMTTVTTTTTTTSSVTPKPLPRILLSSSFILELVHAIYFAMFNGFGTIAIQTLEDIHHRACYEMFTDSILVTNAVRNSLHSNPSGQPSDGPMGLSVALTPATNTVTVSKSMITNASFRTKKLPDDLDMEFLASLPHQTSFDNPSSSINDNALSIIQNSATLLNDEQLLSTDGNNKEKKFDIIKNRKWKNWGWKYSPGSKTSSIEEEPDSPKKSLSSSKNSSPNASPKIKKQPQQQQQQQLKDDQNISVTAVFKRRTSPKHSNKNTIENRLSAGARLCCDLENSVGEDENNSAKDGSEYDFDDEKINDLKLGNGRPASIHLIQTPLDDIPIQGAKDDLQNQASNSALTSITEENEQQIGNRNVGVRTSKDGSSSLSLAKAPHKALIAGFKKSKDKDREKESKNEKLLINKNNGGGNVGGIGGNINNEILSNIKDTSLLSSASPSSSSGILIGTSSSQKQSILNKKSDKISNRNSIQMSNSTDSGGGGGSIIIGSDYEKTTSIPTAIKNKILDVVVSSSSSSPSSTSSLTAAAASSATTTINNNTSDIIQFHNLTNGSESHNNLVICENNTMDGIKILSTVSAGGQPSSSSSINNDDKISSIPPSDSIVSSSSSPLSTVTIPPTTSVTATTVTKRPSLVAAMEDTLQIQISQV